MIKFVMEVSSFFEKECSTTMIHHDMDVYKLMVYAQQVEEKNLSKMNRDGKRARPDEQSQPKSKKRFYNQDSPMMNKYRVSNQNSQGGGAVGSTF